MENRFFDIDSNVYLNSLYISVLLKNGTSIQTIENLILKLFLIKHPRIIECIAKEYDVDEAEKYISSIDDFLIENIEESMMKYSPSLNIDGFYDSLVYLYSKDFITYDNKTKGIIKTEQFNSINLDAIPKSIESITMAINILFDLYSNTNMRSLIKKIERGYHG